MENKKELKQKISKSLDLSSLTGAQQNRIILGLMDNISARISIAVSDKLNARQKEELKKISRAVKKEAVLDYLNSKIKNFSLLTEKIAKETVSDFIRLRNS